MLLTVGVLQIIFALLWIAAIFSRVLPKTSEYPVLWLFVLIPILHIVLGIGLFKKNSISIMISPIICLIVLLIQISYMFKSGINVADIIATVMLLISIAFPIIYLLKVGK